MTQGVDLLKELLFDSEAKKLAELTRRMELLAKTEAQGRSDLATEIKVQQRDTQLLGQRLNEVFERTGTTERFEESVATVLDGALRRAEADRHTALSDAVAPLVVRTIKTEIRNSQDELVEALYPMTGRMVKAYVASAIKDLTNDINRRLEQNPLMLRLRSLATGRSAAELAIADSQQLELEELYLIRRGSGELLARWPDAPGSANRDHVMSGILTAINEFSSEALQEDGSSLREIDLGERQLFLRASPVFLLAAKTSGTAAPDIEAILDDSFLTAIERVSKAPEESSARSGILSAQFTELEKRISEKQAELAEAGMGLSPLKMLAWIIGVPLAAWISWSVFVDYRTERASMIATRILAEDTALSGYPARIEVGRMGSYVTINGLAPTLTAKNGVIAKLKEALPGSDIRDALSVLPSGLAEIEPELQSVRRNVAGLTPEIDKVRRDVLDLEPEIEKVREEIKTLEPKIAGVETSIGAVQIAVAREAMRRDIERAMHRVTQLRTELPRIEALVGPGSERDTVLRTSSAIGVIAKELGDIETAIRSSKPGAVSIESLAPRLDVLTAKLATASLELGTLLPARSDVSAGPTAQPKPAAGPSASAVALSAETERLSRVTESVLQLAAFKKALPPPPAPVVIEKSKEPTAHETLESWVRGNAIFFGNDIDYRNEQRATRIIDELAALMSETDAVIRVVGYTDEQGGQNKNSPLSRSRADKVVAALVAKGISRDRLIALGRNNEREISTEAGPTSPNRRVEFELGFAGEASE